MVNVNRNKYFVGALTASSAVLLMAMSQAYASQLIGAPAGWTKKGDVTVSVDYAQSDAEYKRMLNWDYGDDYGNPPYEVESSSTSFKLGYGVAHGESISVHYGLVNGSEINRYNADWGLDGFGNDLQWASDGGDGDRMGIGADIVVFKSNNWTVGANANWSRVEFDSPTVRVSNSELATENVSFDEFRAAIGAGYSFSDDLMVYGGYVAKFVSGDAYILFSGGDKSAVNPLEEENESGVYVGAALKFGSVLLGLEAQYAGSNDNVIGGSIGYKF